MLLALQIGVSIMFFTYKVMILVGRKTGWLLGAVAAACAIYYFYLIELYVYVALEFGLIALMTYGFMKSDEQKPEVEIIIRGVTMLSMLVMSILAFQGVITIVELASSLGLLVGTFLLTHGRPTSGWLCYAIAHFLAAYLGYAKDQQFFADLQLGSGIVSVVGMMRK